MKTKDKKKNQVNYEMHPIYGLIPVIKTGSIKEGVGSMNRVIINN